MTAIRSLIARGSCWVGRRLSIKRWQTSATYEADWTDMTMYVKSFGTVRESFGNTTYLGDIRIDGMDLVLENSLRKFNIETDYNSFFHGFIRHNSKIKLEYFYYDDDDTEVSGKTFYGIIYGDPVSSDSGEITISVAPLIKVLQNYPASGISSSAGTTAQLVDRLVKKTQNGIRIFDQFFEGATDSDKYKINLSAGAVTTVSAPSIPDDKTVWDKIVDYSLIDDFTAYVDNSGAFVWETKSASVSSVINLNGAGSFDNEDGINIISISEKNGTENFWSVIALEYGVDSGNISTAKANWTAGDGSIQSIYGDRILPLRTTDLTAGEAATVAENLRQKYGLRLKRVWEVKTIMLPHIKLKDMITLNYLGEMLTSPVFVVGVSVLGGTDLLGKRAGSISLSGVQCVVVSASYDYDNCVCDFILWEV